MAQWADILFGGVFCHIHTALVMQFKSVRALNSKLFSPELQCYFLYINKQIRSKVPILLFFVQPKRPSGNCYVSCFLTDKTVLIES